MSPRLLSSLLALLLITACAGPSSELPDGGSGTLAEDAGATDSPDSGAGVDAGIDEPDAGTEDDAGTALDAGTEVDAGAAESDAGIEDAGTIDAGVSCGIAEGDWPLVNGRYCFRVMAANTTSGNYQSYEAPGIRIFQGLDPDIVLVQEFSYRDGTLEDLVGQSMGPGACHYREPESGGIPNGVMSRFPIIESGEWQDTQVGNRDFAWARIDIPGPKDLWVVSVHFLTSSAADRSAQATALVNRIQSDIDGGYVIVGGDFNTSTRTENAISKLSQVVVTGGPHPEDQSGNSNTNSGRTKPYDWVLASPDLDAQEAPVVIGTNSFPNGLVFDSRVYAPLGGVPPVLQSDSAASQMQHMAVMRTFCVIP